MLPPTIKPPGRTSLSARVASQAPLVGETLDLEVLETVEEVIFHHRAVGSTPVAGHMWSLGL
jgi:hypothetical protein